MRTRRVDTGGPGLRRRGRGRGFSYHEEDGERITDAETLERVRELAIPPAWSEVWICPHPRGHIQATGHDDAGRKQYIYHSAWREHRDRIKFDEMLELAQRLPALRAQIQTDLEAEGLVFRRIVACAARLLDLGLFRIGSERYETENRSYGLATLKRSHVEIRDGVATFRYPAKAGKTAVHRLSNPDVMPTLLALRRLPGKRTRDLLVYREDGEWRELRSEQINDYLGEHAGELMTAKGFRTWNATVLAATLIAVHGAEATTKAERRRISNLVVRQTAEYLNNTPAVCRASYIDPRVFDRFDSGETIRPALKRIESATDPGEFIERERIERAVIRLLD